MWAAEMGVGKSRAAIELMRRMGWPRTIIVAPAAVIRSVWPQQLELWGDSNLRYTIIDGKVLGRSRQSAGQRRIAMIMSADIVLINYESIHRDPVGGHLKHRFKAELLIMDESHRIKSPSGVISRYMAQLANRVPKRLAMTGTPMPHSPMDIYAQYRALDKEIFGVSAQHFRFQYAIRHPLWPGVIVGWKCKGDLRKRFERIAIQVKADDVLSLPPFVDSTYMVELSTNAKRLIDEAKNEFILEVKTGIITIPNALVKLLRLQQIASGFLHPEGGILEVFDTAKMDALSSIFEDIGETHVVVFCRFRQDLIHIAKTAVKSDLLCWEISGEKKQLEQWNSEGGVLAVQMQSGGLGLDFTKARTAIYYSLGYSLGDYMQTRARVHRPGQEQSVHYIHLIASDSVDIDIMRAINKKKEIISEIIDGINSGGWEL